MGGKFGETDAFVKDKRQIVAKNIDARELLAVDY